MVAETLLDDLEAGRIRAAEPDPDQPRRLARPSRCQGGDPGPVPRPDGGDWTAGPLTFRDRAAVPPRDVSDGPWRVVPGGTAVRRGAYLGADVVVMPPSYVNVGAWVGDGTMVDSHVLVGSCAQVGARVHLAAGVTIGGVLEPPGRARSSWRTTPSSARAVRCSKASSSGAKPSSRPG